MALLDLWPKVMPAMLGQLELITAPVAAPITTSEAKTHCRVEHSDEDAYISGLIDKAVEWVQDNIDGHRQLMAATYDLPLTGFWCGPLKLPRPPLLSVGSVKRYDEAGALQTLATSYYLVRTPWRQPGVIELAPDQDWPQVQASRDFPVVIRFTAGYASAGAVPAKLKQAILLLVGHWYRHRGDEVVPGTGRESVLPMTLQSLLAAEAWGSYA